MILEFASFMFSFSMLKVVGFCVVCFLCVLCSRYDISFNSLTGRGCYHVLFSFCYFLLDMIPNRSTITISKARRKYKRSYTENYTYEFFSQPTIQLNICKLITVVLSVNVLQFDPITMDEFDFLHYGKRILCLEKDGE